jgi:hypothetical protein
VSAAAARRSPRLLPEQRAIDDPRHDPREPDDHHYLKELTAMLLSVWDYLRRRTAESVLLGIQDALAATERPATEVAGELVLELELRREPPGDQTAPASPPLQLASSQASVAPNQEPRRGRGRPRKHPSTP